METTRDIVIKVQAQAGRIASELESEKRTRSESHSALHTKLDRLESRTRNIEIKIAIAIGIILAAQAANFFGIMDRYKQNPKNEIHTSNPHTLRSENRFGLSNRQGLD